MSDHGIRSCLIAKLKSQLNFKFIFSHYFGVQPKDIPYFHVTVTNVSIIGTSDPCVDGHHARHHGRIKKITLTAPILCLIWSSLQRNVRLHIKPPMPPHITVKTAVFDQLVLFFSNIWEHWWFCVHTDVSLQDHPNQTQNQSCKWGSRRCNRGIFQEN